MSTLAELPQLVGFFSYSREDDTDSGEALSELRDHIRRELRGQLGRTKDNFRLWQDREAIACGQDWHAEIKNAIDESIFFIPIVTPTTVRSHYCRTEFEWFLAREAQLGRGDLVFPIHYIRVPLLEDEGKWRNHPVLSVVGRRQWADWQRLRLAALDSSEVREAIARFCEQIVQALEKPWRPADAGSSPRQESSGSSSPTTACVPGESGRQLMIPIRALAAEVRGVHDRTGAHEYDAGLPAPTNGNPRPADTGSRAKTENASGSKPREEAAGSMDQARRRIIAALKSRQADAPSSRRSDASARNAPKPKSQDGKWSCNLARMGWHSAEFMLERDEQRYWVEYSYKLAMTERVSVNGKEVAKRGQLSFKKGPIEIPLTNGSRALTCILEPLYEGWDYIRERLTGIRVSIDGATLLEHRR